MSTRNLALMLFVVSISVLSFLYGVASTHWQLWPHGVLVDAKTAFEAFKVKAGEELWDQDPIDFEYFDPDGSAEPVVSYVEKGRDYGDDLILINGGILQYSRLCPDFGCLAWIVDRQGDVKHTWEVDLSKVWGEFKAVYGFTSVDRLYPIDFHLYDNGDLLVGYQSRNTFPYGIGLAKFDKDSNLLWSKENYNHHWFRVADNGNIVSPSFKLLPIPHRLGDTHLYIDCHNGGMVEDVVSIMDKDGIELEQFSILDSLIDSGYIGVVFQKELAKATLALREKKHVLDSCDPTHLNSVIPLNKADADQYPSLNEGDLLISLRNLNAVMIVDRVSKQVKWLSQGVMVMQHSARYFRDNKILVFDNQGGSSAQGGSRVVAIDVGTGEHEVIYPTPETPDDIYFTSYTSGDLRLSDDRSTALVSLTREGRVVEIDMDSRKRTWEYTNSHDISHFYDIPEGDPNKNRIARFSIHTAQYVRPKFDMNRADPNTTNK